MGLKRGELQRHRDEAQERMTSTSKAQTIKAIYPYLAPARGILQPS